MNNERRRIVQRLRMKLMPLLEDAIALKEAEEEAFENIPQSMQGGDLAYKIQEAIGQLETAVDGIQEAIDALETAEQ